MKAATKTSRKLDGTALNYNPSAKTPIFPKTIHVKTKPINYESKLV
jgi:hypothetical protein